MNSFVKLNGISLKVLNKVFRVLEILGLSLWRLNSYGSARSNISFSYFGLCLSVLTVIAVLCAIIVQHAKIYAGFDTAVSNNMSSLVSYLTKIQIYTHIFAIFVPIWMLRKKMRSILTKILKVNRILAEIDVNMVENFITPSLTVKICVWLLTEMIFYVLSAKLSSDVLNTDSGMTWDGFLTYGLPPIFKSLFILHFITVMSLFITRMAQIQSILDGIK